MLRNEEKQSTKEMQPSRVDYSVIGKLLIL